MERGWTERRGAHPRSAGRGGGRPDWTVVRSQLKLDKDPPRGDSLWRPATATAPMVRVEIFELPAVAAARAHLLDVLANVQSAEFGRRTDLAVDDVVFGFDTALLFARANSVVFVRNAPGRR
jgi:hypothetical protein